MHEGQDGSRASAHGGGCGGRRDPLVFLLVHVVPGDPVQVMLGEQASAADRAEPARRSVSSVRWRGNGATSRLAGARQPGHVVRHRSAGRRTRREPRAHDRGARGAALLVALVSACRSACGRPGPGGAWDRASTVFAVAGMSVPNFVLGPLLISCSRSRSGCCRAARRARVRHRAAGADAGPHPGGLPRA